MRDSVTRSVAVATCLEEMASVGMTVTPSCVVTGTSISVLVSRGEGGSRGLAYVKNGYRSLIVNNSPFSY